jgi:hypothetical protein
MLGLDLGYSDFSNRPDPDNSPKIQNPEPVLVAATKLTPRLTSRLTLQWRLYSFRSARCRACLRWRR